MKKYTWTNDQEFSGNIEIAHYGKDDLNDTVISWKVVNGSGDIYHSGEIRNSKIARGGLVNIGEIKFPLDKSSNAEKIEIIISVEETKYRNKYDLWVYPEFVDTNIPEGIIVSEQLNAKTIKHLKAKGKAIIFPKQKKLTHYIKRAFQTDYWCYPMFARAAINRGIEPAPGSLGFICDPKSPLLEQFPTEFHSNW